jgi:hypothetical protein
MGPTSKKSPFPLDIARPRFCSISFFIHCRITFSDIGDSFLGCMALQIGLCLFQLEHGFIALAQVVLHRAAVRINTSLEAFRSLIAAGLDSTKERLVVMCWAKAVLYTFKRYLAIMNGTTRMAYSNAIHHDGANPTYRGIRKGDLMFS